MFVLYLFLTSAMVTQASIRPDYESWDCKKCQATVGNNYWETEGYTYCMWENPFYKDGGCVPNVEYRGHFGHKGSWSRWIPCGQVEGDKVVEKCPEEEPSPSVSVSPRSAEEIFGDELPIYRQCCADTWVTQPSEINCRAGCTSCNCRFYGGRMCGCPNIHILSDEGYAALKHHMEHAPAAQPSIPPTHEAFDPKSRMVSYYDENKCGARGSYARADLKSCGDAGYSIVAEFKWLNLRTFAAVVDGCRYTAYTVYKCNGNQEKETVMINNEPCPLEYVIKADDDESHDCVKDAPHFDKEGDVCGIDNETLKKSYCSYSLGEANNCARCAAKQIVRIRDKPCPLSKVVIVTEDGFDFDCVKGAPHFQKEGSVCANFWGGPSVSYCSYDLGDKLNCARCAENGLVRAPDFDGDFSKFYEYCQNLEDCSVCGGKLVKKTRCRYNKSPTQVRCNRLKAEVCEAAGCTPKVRNGVFSKCRGKSNLK